MLGPLDHLGGAAFGFVKGIFVVEMLMIIFAAYPDLELDSAVANSEVARYFVDEFDFLQVILPSDIDGRIDLFNNPEEPPADQPLT
jgi:uncharacterized membrane protein required for colicin V production